ncbi:hypothetical protein MIND_00246300 [Mycena indigotica]|uniref:XLF-like N-terminal domain-containing protein n=1 Tax=Mycena indigotica TaxID=2126181 RepID=A0A8H6WBZ9_9AGAR|nr:uncharacterized protein MIND_00246300 [Mycena indigotica]KAF7312332.1 hypothetical protein MIND_00246300 [Mycena indigotica]
MEVFSEVHVCPKEHSKLLLNKEWLVATNNSTPYLFKFATTVDLACLVLVTDTKTIWTEVLNSKQFARRWRACNPDSSPDFSRDEDEEDWRVATQTLLAKAHTLGGLSELSFDCVESNYADLAIELEGEAFKWRWETCTQGGRFSADIISRHLVLPLISLTHLAFTSTSAVGESSESDLEKAIDKVGRTARRSVDTHVKNCIGKPGVATALRRITALFNSIPDLPSVLLVNDTPDLKLPPLATQPARAPSPPLTKRRISTPVDKSPVIEPTSSPVASKRPSPEPVQRNSSPEAPLDAESGSATESDSDGAAPVPIAAKGKARAFSSGVSPPVNTKIQSPVHRQLSSSSPPSKPLSRPKPVLSDSESSPVRPAKKTKPPVSSSDDDSEAERKKRLAKVKSGGGAARGAKQPIKRGGRRF